jgi:tetratricopeptide (TPR) repeat protein
MKESRVSLDLNLNLSLVSQMGRGECATSSGGREACMAGLLGFPSPPIVAKKEGVMNVVKGALLVMCGVGLLALEAVAEPGHDNQPDDFALGVLASERGQVDRAIELFEGVVWLEPNHAEAHYNLGVLKGEQGRWDDAMLALAKAAALRPKDHEPHLAMGIVATQKGDDNRAIHEFIETLKLQPDFAEAHFRLAEIYQRRKLDDMAVGEYRATVRCDPQNLPARFALGYLSDKKGDLDEAIRYFREVTEIDPRQVEGHYNLGLAYGRKSMVGLADLPTPDLTDYNVLAMEAFQKTLSWNPNHAGARYNLAVSYLYQGRGDVKRAKEHLEILASLDPPLAEKLADKIESVTQKEGAH